MKNRNDELKQLKAQVENEFIDTKYVEDIGRIVLDGLVEWANKNIYDGLNGKLSYKIPLGVMPNACAIVENYHYHHRIEINLIMLIEMYKDSFTFPIISKRIEMETSTIKDFHEVFSKGLKHDFMFETGMPQVTIRNFLNLKLKSYLLACVKMNEEEIGDKRINLNDRICRFIMFELMVAWVFFHELSHLIQRHYMLKPNVCSLDDLQINEFDGNESIDICGQAREVLADIEGIDLTLKYMNRLDIFEPKSLYLLLCCTNCMFLKFYQGYDDNLNLCLGTHPHPVIRNEFCLNYISHWMINFLKCEPKQAGLPLSYYSARSSVMCGIFHANRVEKIDASRLPTYMELQSESNNFQRRLYMDILGEKLLKIIPSVKYTRIVQSNILDILEKMIQIHNQKS